MNFVHLDSKLGFGPTEIIKYKIDDVLQRTKNKKKGHLVLETGVLYQYKERRSYIVIRITQELTVSTSISYSGF